MTNFMAKGIFFSPSLVASLSTLRQEAFLISLANKNPDSLTPQMMNKMVNNKKQETEKVLKEMQKKNNKEKKAKEHKEQEENYEFEYDESIEDE